jgi:hypothetical protein
MEKCRAESPALHTDLMPQGHAVADSVKAVNEWDRADGGPVGAVVRKNGHPQKDNPTGAGVRVWRTGEPG